MVYRGGPPPGGGPPGPAKSAPGALREKWSGSGHGLRPRVSRLNQFPHVSPLFSVLFTKKTQNNFPVRHPQLGETISGPDRDPFPHREWGRFPALLGPYGVMGFWRVFVAGPKAELDVRKSETPKAS